MSITTSANGLTLPQEHSQQRADKGTINGYMNAVQFFPHLDIFLKIEPKALGTVQTIIGFVIFLLGVFMRFSTFSNSIVVLTWILCWGPIIFIIAGSLSIAAENKLNPCLVKCSLGVNVISAVAAGMAIFILTADNIHAVRLYRFSLYNCSFGNVSWPCVCGINGVLLLFCLLQLIISICLSAFACKATTSNDPQTVALTLNQQSYSQPSPDISNIIEDYVNVNMMMSRVTNGQREREHHLTSRSDIGQNDEHQYEQPIENYMLSIC